LEWIYILQSLQEYALPRDVKSVMKSYLQDRWAEVAGDSFTINRRVERGCAQGSVLGPALWNISVERLLKELVNSGLKVIAYVDDIAIVIAARTKAQIEAARALELIEAWSGPAGVSISYPKSAFILLKGKLAAGSPPVIRLNGNRIGTVTELKYLGITIGTRMASAPLARDRSDAAIAKLNALKTLGGATWGFNYRNRSLLFNAVIKPVLLYACEAWGPGLPNYAIKQLQQAHRKALIWVSSSYRTAAYLTLCAIVGDPPIGLQIRKRERLQIAKSHGALTQEVIEEIEHEVLTEWQASWDQANVGRYTHGIIPNVEVRKGYKWKVDHIVTQFLSGHGDFGAKLYEFRRREEPDCDCGEGEESAVHVLRDCPKYSRLRHEAEVEGLNLQTPSNFTKGKNFETFSKLCHRIARVRGTHGARK